MLKIKLCKPSHGFQANTYIISSAGECAIVDPSVPYDQSLLDGSLKYILLTHAHFDHMLDIDSWVDNTEATVIISEQERDALPDPIRNCYKFFDGSDKGYFGDALGIEDMKVLPFGDTEIKVISCPGHTVGSVCYLCDGNAFVGDTVFAGGGYGRFDLPTGDLAMLRDSIDRIVMLDCETVLYPGHGTTTTVKEYKRDIGR